MDSFSSPGYSLSPGLLALHGRRGYYYPYGGGLRRFHYIVDEEKARQEVEDLTPSMTSQ